MVELNGHPISADDLHLWACGTHAFSLGSDARSRMAAGRSVVDAAIQTGDAIYGVNTGFGRLSDVRIPDDKLTQLQVNLIRSHACGFGPALSIEESRAMMILRANVLALGRSGARPEVADLLCECLSRGVTPVIPSRGSVGASGDLAPLAHLALVLIGEGEAWFHGQRIAGGEALRLSGIEPLIPAAKEGLALLNGTQAIGAVGNFALHEARELLWMTAAIGGMTLEALKGTPVAFDARIHEARRHSSQIKVAEYLLEFLKDSDIRESHRQGDSRVQDAYCLRCIPQVIGAALEVLSCALEAFQEESAAATDNPLVFAEEGEMLSGGNFHAAPLALWLDAASIALVSVMSQSERRTDRLVNPEANEGLPAFLAKDPGLESGYMMLHVSVAAALNEARVLAHPASTDNTPTSGGKEDHVSMGMTAALKFRQIVELAKVVFFSEAICASTGLEFRRPLRSSVGVEKLFEWVRHAVPEGAGDRPHGDSLRALVESWNSRPSDLGRH